MGAPSGGSLVGKQVAKLPVPEHNDRLPWPYYAVDPAARATVVTAQRVQTITLGPLGAAPVVAPAPAAPAPPMPIPVGAKRVAGPSSTSASAPAVPPSAATLRPPTSAAPMAQPAQVKVPAAVAVSPQMAPRRTAGPMTASGASSPASSSPSVPMVSYPSSAGSQPPAPYVQAGKQVPAPVRGAAGGPLATQRAAQGVRRLGTASLVLGLLGILLPLIAGVPAIICGHLALRRADPVWTPERLKRRAQWGLALGYLTSLAWLAYFLVLR